MATPAPAPAPAPAPPNPPPLDEAHLQAIYHHDDHLALIDQARIQPHEHVLDLACGLGRLSLAAAQRTSGTVVGIDRQRDLVTEASTNVPPADRTRVLFRVGDILTMHDHQQSPFQFDVQFNVVFASWILHILGDIPPIARVVVAIHPYLAPNARLVFDWCDQATRGESAAAVLFHRHSHQVLHTFQWVDPERVNLCVQALQQLVNLFNMTTLRPVQLVLGDGRYHDTTSQIPQKFKDYVPTFLDYVSNPPRRQLPAVLQANPDIQRHITRFLQLYRQTETGPFTDVAAFVRQLHPVPVGTGRDPQMRNGEKWRRLVMPMYASIASVIYTLEHPTIGTVAETDVVTMCKGIQVSGVFQYGPNGVD